MADFPAMPLWTDAYLADTRHLSDAEHGRYLLMLMDMWRMPEKRFPNDDAWLARKFGRPIEDIEALFRPLISEFFRTDGNWIKQKRLTREWQKVRATYQRRSDSAKSMWRKKKNQRRADAAPALQPQPQPQPQPLKESTPSLFPYGASEGAAPDGAGEKAAKPRRRPSQAMPDDWSPDLDYARSQGMSDREINLQANKLVDWAKANDKRYVDWSAVWRNWVRSYLERGHGSKVH